MADAAMREAEDLGRLCEEGRVVAYFGYGSLANRATHRTDIVHAVPARLEGRRRAWRPRPDMPGFSAALLSVEAHETSSCDGLLVFDLADNLPAVDRREARYVRRDVAHATLLLDFAIPASCPVYVYEAQTELPPHREPPLILRSYLDAVLQGFLHHHGEEGVHRFVDETDNWHIGIVDDRAAPLYPRPVRLSAAERGFFDQVLGAAGVEILPLDR